MDLASLSSKVRRVSPTFLVLTFLAHALLMSHPADTTAGLRQTGRWSDRYNFFNRAIHLATMRGNGDSTKVVYWSSGDSVHMWDPATGGTTHPKRFPTNTNQALDNIFCAGHSTLSDGRLFVVGGDYPHGIGLDKTYIFNALTRAWSAGPVLKSGRWYATATTIGQDTVLTLSGSKFDNLLVYGGRDTGVIDSLRILTNTTPPFWKPALSPSTALPAREGHSAISWASQRRNYSFGGKNGTSAYNDVWMVQYHRTANTSEDSVTVSQLSPDTTNGNPARRYGHSVIAYPAPTSTGQATNDSTLMIVYGGVRQDGTVLDDIWRLHIYSSSAPKWERIVPSGTGPGARFGHGAVYHPGPPSTQDPSGKPRHPRMFVFGGKSSTTGQPTDSTLWQLTLDATPTWSAVTLRDTSAVPAARESLSLIADEYQRNRLEVANPWTVVREARIILYGGRNQNGILSDGKVWMLWIPDSVWTASSGKGITWESNSPAADNGRTPAPRAGHVGMHDVTRDQFVFVGGDTLAGRARDIWAFQQYHGGHYPSWHRWFTLYDPPGRLGHTMVALDRGLFARTPERTNSSLTSWSEMTSSSKYMLMYPQAMLLPSGNVVKVGTEEATQILNPGTGSWENRTSAYTTTGHKSGSAVMYRPGEIMKCGGGEGGPDTTTKTIVFTGSGDTSSGWQNVAGGMTKRFAHNLTVLPTGEVLVTGGTSVYNEVDAPTSSAQYQPQLWNRTTGKWSAGLAADPAMRDYHSAAVLLPDGRVLSAGGQSTNNVDRCYATIYSPYYLFSRADSTTDSTYATRPVIEAYSGTISWGGTFTICTGAAANTIAMVSLIKPGAATHGFNQDQYFIPLTFEQDGCSQSRTLTVNEPVGRYVAPPGDYLLFIVKNDSTPSLGKWVRVANEAGEDEFCIDYCNFGEGAAMDLPEGDSWLFENNLLSARSREPQMDFYRLAREPARDGEAPTVRLRGPGDGQVLLDEFRLGSVAHPPNTEAVAIDDQIFVGRLQGGEVSRSSGAPLPAMSDDAPWVTARTETLEVTSTEPEPSDGTGGGQSGRALRLRWQELPDLAHDAHQTRPEDEGSFGVQLQRLSEAGEWMNVRTGQPRHAWSDLALPLPSEAGRIRVLLSSGLAVKGVDVLQLRREPAALQFVDVKRAQHSRIGSMHTSMAVADGSTAELAAGDTLEVSFAVKGTAAQGHRSWFACLRGAVVPPVGATAEVSAAQPKWQFALHAARPNPSIGGVTFSYSLASASPVQLTLYDLAGRRVRTLVRQDQAAGPYEVVWNGLDEQGRRSPSGVYFYKIKAGEWHSEKKLIRLGN